MNLLGPNSAMCTHISVSLNTFICDCNAYVSQLSQFEQYCIFRYTLGSSSINHYLIHQRLGPNALEWCYLFFQYWYNTSPTPGLGLLNHFRYYRHYFEHPPAYMQLSLLQQERIAKAIIPTYAKVLQAIILAGPRVKGAGFYVYKMTKKYDALPNSIKSVPDRVTQSPFNSTSYSPSVNYIIFSDLQDDCCMFRIRVPAGSQCLLIPAYLGSYMFEYEILLPQHVSFYISNIEKGQLNYIHPLDLNVKMVQPKNRIRMGNVYKLNPYCPCKSGKCKIRTKDFIIYDAELFNA